MDVPEYLVYEFFATAFFIPAPGKIVIILKKKDFTISGKKVKLSRPSAYPLELSGLLKELFDSTISS